MSCSLTLLQCLLFSSIPHFLFLLSFSLVIITNILPYCPFLSNVFRHKLWSLSLLQAYPITHGIAVKICSSYGSWETERRCP